MDGNCLRGGGVVWQAFGAIWTEQAIKMQSFAVRHTELRSNMLIILNTAVYGTHLIQHLSTFDFSFLLAMLDSPELQQQSASQ